MWVLIAQVAIIWVLASLLLTGVWVGLSVWTSERIAANNIRTNEMDQS